MLFVEKQSPNNLYSRVSSKYMKRTTEILSQQTASNHYNSTRKKLTQ
jgi:hypothetical protein